MENANKHAIWFKDCSYKNRNLVGGKCSSLGELYKISKEVGFKIGDGFALTTTLYDDFIVFNNFEIQIESILESINTENLKELEEKSKQLRDLVSNGTLPIYSEDLIISYYEQLCKQYNF